VETVTMFDTRLIANIGTGVEEFGVEMAVREEMLALCGNPNGANARQVKSKNVQRSSKRRRMGSSSKPAACKPGDLSFYPTRNFGASGKTALNAP